MPYTYNPLLEAGLDQTGSGAPGDITAVNAGTGLSGGGTTGDVTLSLANTAVAAGTYSLATVTVDAQGRITAASSGSATTPGGSTTQIQFNNAGAFGGIASSAVGASGDITLSLNGAASVPPFKLAGTWFTGGTATTTKPQVLIEPSGTTSTAWNTSGTGIGVNAASGFTGNLLDLQVNGTSQAKFPAAGGLTISGQYGVNLAGNAPPAAYRIQGANNNYIDIGNLGHFRFVGASNTDNLSIVYQGLLQVANIGGYAWTSSSNTQGTVDLVLYRDAANTLAQRNGTSAQTIRVYNTYTDASNYERLSTTWSSNVCYTKPENAGTGSARLYVPVTGSTTVASLPSASTAGAGARAFVTDATATTFLSTVAGGGANKVPVVSDGTNWLIG